MSDIVLVWVLICGTILLIALGIMAMIWRKDVGADKLRSVKNWQAAEDASKLYYEKRNQLSGKT